MLIIFLGDAGKFSKCEQYGTPCHKYSYLSQAQIMCEAGLVREQLILDPHW